jgi:hypothetical protein
MTWWPYEEYPEEERPRLRLRHEKDAANSSRILENSAWARIPGPRIWREREEDEEDEPEW